VSIDLAQQKPRYAEVNAKGAILNPSIARTALAIGNMKNNSEDSLADLGFRFKSSSEQVCAWERCRIASQKEMEELRKRPTNDGTIGGCKLDLDESIPAEEMHFVDAGGNIVVKIKNLSPPLPSEEFSSAILLVAAISQEVLSPSQSSLDLLVEAFLRDLETEHCGASGQEKNLSPQLVALLRQVKPDFALGS
jgi:hypothetical protein